jgi:hypothetical protein
MLGCGMGGRGGVNTAAAAAAADEEEEEEEEEEEDELDAASDGSEKGIDRESGDS